MTIPPNCTATADLPGSKPVDLPEGTYHMVLPHSPEQASLTGDDTDA
jgi:hypothetical protein